MFPRDHSISPMVEPKMEAAGIEPAQDSPDDDPDWIVQGGTHLYVIWWAQYAGSHPSSKRPTILYVVGEPDNGPVKIGITEGSPEKRIAALQTSNPRDLSLIVSLPIPFGFESAAHQLCYGQHIRGEWFERRDETQDLIDVLRSIARVVGDYEQDGIDLDAEDIYTIIYEDARRLGMVPEHALEPFAEFWSEEP